MTNTPDFQTWSHTNLAKFSQEAYTKMCEQDDRIQQLQCDLKTAIEAYRTLNEGAGASPVND
ncbi:hypothetical protein UFOVP173_37 [uncultured Caudovirales phage]|uniref:Uncharacterized protein n=1 Tax=uncultured Caudovirales phage TaxID=2100421 RepID=A0A6J7WF81_9CAUD|nr:hypothetical protein UFOVP173_37 [uncultured Caudovirales phage]